MIELGTRPVVTLQAAPFGFGPISTHLAIAAELRKLDIALVWLAEGSSLELLEASCRGVDDYVVPFSLARAEDRERCAHFVEEADAVLVNTDPDFAAYAIGLNKHTVYVDILHWMWHELPPVIRQCSLYVFEEFVRTQEQMRRLETPGNALRVGPLITPVHSQPVALRPGAARHLLVSIGGLNRPGYQSRSILAKFRDGVYRSVVDSLPLDGTFDRVYFAGGGVEPRRTRLACGVEVLSGCLPRDEYLRLLSTARAAVLAPGLTGFYEAAAVGTPTFFLPPHNYSQYLQLESYKAVLGDAFFCDWQRLGVPGDLPCFLPEDQMLRTVDAALVEVVARLDGLTDRLRPFLFGGFERYDPVPVARMLNESRGAEGCAHAAARVAGEIVRRLALRRGREVRHAIRSQAKPVPLPRKITLELFGGCQLRCPLCPTGRRLTPGRGRGPVAIETVKALLDQAEGHVEVMELFNWGEPFLHPHACQIISMISDRGIHTVVSSNLQRIPEPDSIIDSGLGELIFSCHGMTQSVYERYMVGGSVTRALTNLDLILAAGGTAMRMKITLRFVVFAHNQHELPLAHERFRGTPVVIEEAPMRMDMRDEILWSPERNLQMYGQWVPESSRFYDKSKARATRAPLGCNLPFEEMTIDVDGSVSPCCSCYDPGHNVGNFLRDGGLSAVWNGDAYRQSRQVVTGRNETGRETVVCRTCKLNGYRDF